MSTLTILHGIVSSVALSVYPLYPCSSPFQYPPSDRGLCNLNERGYLVRRAQAFSILHRIVGSVTFQPTREGGFDIIFQYPPSDRGLCNPATPPAAARPPPDFQYPPSDRGLCN